MPTLSPKVSDSVRAGVAWHLLLSICAIMRSVYFFRAGTDPYAMMIHVSQSKDSPGARKLCAEAVEIVADVHKRVKRIYGKFPDWILEENLGALRERMAKWADE